MSARKNPDDRVELEDIVAAMIEGEPVAWERAAEQLGPRWSEVLEQLRAIASIMSVHRLDQRSQMVAAAGSSTGVAVRRSWGPLRLDRRIGSGGFSEVYAALDPRLDRTIALKLIHPRRIHSTADRAAIVDEARLLAKVRHRNIVAVYGVEQHVDRVGILMEFIAGSTFEDILREQGPMSPEEALVVGRDVCRALAVLHGADILHRDVKSRNVMREIGGRIVLMDLGLGCRREGTEAAGRLGTPIYCAPELLRGERATRRSDLYALGVLLFHLVTGAYPVIGETTEEILASHRAAKVLRLRDLRPDLPETFVRLVERTTDPDPVARPASAGELSKDLVDALAERTPLPLDRTARRSSIAVLPFRDLSPGHDHDYLCEGLAEQLIHALGHLRDLRVVARSSSFFYKDRQVDIAEIGRHLDVKYLLDGSIRVDGDRIRVAAQLVAVADARQIWSGQFDRGGDDILAVEDEISRAIVDHVADLLVGDAIQPAHGRRCRDAEAWRLYLQGRYLFNQGGRTDLDAARKRFQAAAKRDPGFAAAHVGVATCHAYRHAFGSVSAREDLELAGEATRRALACDPSLAEVHATLAFVQLLEWQWDAALAALERALAIDPDCPTANHYLALYLQAVGRLEEARAVQEHYVARDPWPRFAHGWLALFRLRAGRLTGAGELPEALEPQPSDSPFWQVLRGQSHVLEGRVARGIAELRAGLRERAGDPFLLASLGWACGSAGRRREARRILARLRERRALRPIRPFLPARVCAGLGDLDEAFAWLDAAIEERDPSLIMIRSDQTVAPLRDDPRFAEVLRRLHLA
jgi:serine/threonine-protein kinase